VSREGILNEDTQIRRMPAKNTPQEKINRKILRIPCFLTLLFKEFEAALRPFFILRILTHL
jgi:hypothetical protein